MKLNEIVDMEITAEEYFKGCQDLPDYPDITGEIAKFPVGKNTVYILKSKIMPYSNTFFSAVIRYGYPESVGRNAYDEIKDKEFYFIVCVGRGGNVDNAYVPDEVFTDVAQPQIYVVEHQDELGKVL